LTGLLHIRSDVAGVAWPPVSIGAKATLADLLRQLERLQWIAASDIEASQHRQLGLLAEHAWRHSVQFRERLGEAGLAPGDLAARKGLRRLAPLRRRDIQAAGHRFFCAEVPASHKPLSVARTSGATGEPIEIRRTEISRLFWMAHNVRDHLWHERDPGKRVSVMRAQNTRYAEHQSWGAPMSLLFDTGASQFIPITTDARPLAELLQRFAPDTFLTYPSCLDALARHCRRHATALHSIHHIWTIGETLAPATRELVQETFRLDVEDTYSSEEAGIIAIQCPASGLYHTMEGVIVEVLDDSGHPCEEGEIGRVVVTDLHNFASPLVRYAIGDYAEAAGPCPCGRGLPALRRIVGRERNLIVMPDGTRHWPRVGFDRFRDIAPIAQYQLVQHDRERIEVRLVCGLPLSSSQEAALREVIQGALGFPFALHFVYFEREIPRPASGKFEEFVCRVSDDLRD
jgi:phenylacetate-coenzyme A ligase PaaK-like adenylate-forming protein